MHRLALVLGLAALAAKPPFPVMAQSAPQSAEKATPFVLVPTDNLDRDLPYWLRFHGEERLRFEGFTGGGFQPDNRDAYILNRLRLDMVVAPVSWLGFLFEMQDARVAFKNLKPYASPYQDTFNLRAAYIQLGDNEKTPASLRVGRQEINLGDERLVGSSGWTNTARTFDAARLHLHSGKYRLDAFAASPVVLHDGEVGQHVAGNNLHGLYGGLENLIGNSTIEPYLLWRLNQRLKTETGGIGNLDMTTAGIRWVGKLPGQFDFSLEMARQQGSLGADGIDAWAGHWLLGHILARTWSPRLITEFNYATGDPNARDGRRNTFNQLFPSGHDKYGLADQVGWQNIEHGRTGIEIKPASRWTAAARFSGYWLADRHDALYNSAGTAVVQRADGSAGRFVGTEIDAVVNYIYSNQLQIGGGFAHLFTGTFLNRTTPGRDYNYPYVMLTAKL